MAKAKKKAKKKANMTIYVEIEKSFSFRFWRKLEVPTKFNRRQIDKAIRETAEDLDLSSKDFNCFSKMELLGSQVDDAHETVKEEYDRGGW